MRVNLADSGYRAVRVVSDPDQTPWVPATIARAEDNVMLVDTALLPEDWPGWTVKPGGHVLAAKDVVRHEAGHWAVVPYCTERISSLIAKRTQVPLSEGEVLTLTVSVLRGLAVLRSADRQRPAQWWVTEDGMPVLVPGCGTQSADGESVAILESITGGSAATSTLLREAVAVIASGGPARLFDDLEARLFASADPEPLATTVLGAPSARARIEEVPLEKPATRGVSRGIRSLFGDDFSDVAARATTAVWRKARVPTAGKRGAPWAVAAAIGVVVVILGLFWPTDAETSAVDGESERVVPVATAASRSPQPLPSDPVTALEDDPVNVDESADADLAGVAQDLLTKRRRCGTDQECLVTVIEGPATVLPEGAIDQPSAEIMFLDSFGGAAVLRVQASGHATQMLTLVQVADQWRIRGAITVAVP